MLQKLIYLNAFHVLPLQLNVFILIVLLINFKIIKFKYFYLSNLDIHYLNFQLLFHMLIILINEASKNILTNNPMENIKLY